MNKIISGIQRFIELSGKSRINTKNQHRLSRSYNDATEPETNFTYGFPVSYWGNANISGKMSPNIEAPNAYVMAPLLNMYQDAVKPVIVPVATTPQEVNQKTVVSNNKNSQTGVSVPYVPSANCYPTFGFVHHNQS